MKKEIAIFSEENLELIGRFKTLKSVAEYVGTSSGNIKKYLDLEICTLYGNVIVYINPEDNQESIFNKAVIRYNRALIAKLDRTHVIEIKDEDIVAICNILNKYDFKLQHNNNIAVAMKKYRLKKLAT